MKLWISSEADIDVAEQYREVRYFLEPEINKYLEEIVFDNNYDKWAYVAMIRDNKNWAVEIAKKHVKRKVLEFRLKIDHGDFLNGNFYQRVALFIDALQRSIEKMEKLGVSENDRDKLSVILESVRAPLTHE
ncbi:Imm44 family immunity protein [Klebsiella aerogenes]